jgi:hypothetical protein
MEQQSRREILKAAGLLGTVGALALVNGARSAGAETITGAKTFSANPVFNAGAIPDTALSSNVFNADLILSAPQGDGYFGSSLVMNTRSPSNGANWRVSVWTATDDQGSVDNVTGFSYNVSEAGLGWVADTASEPTMHMSFESRWNGQAEWNWDLGAAGAYPLGYRPFGMYYNYSTRAVGAAFGATSDPGKVEIFGGPATGWLRVTMGSIAQSAAPFIVRDPALNTLFVVGYNGTGVQKDLNVLGNSCLHGGLFLGPNPIYGVATIFADTQSNLVAMRLRATQTRYRTDFQMQSGGLNLIVYDDAGAASLPLFLSAKGTYVQGDGGARAGYFGLSNTSGIGNGANANIQAPSVGTGTGPANPNLVVKWTKVYDGLNTRWVPLFA